MRAALENYEDEVAPKLEALVAEDEALHLALTNAYGDLETALEYLVLITDEHACDGDSFPDRVLHVDHVLCKPIVRESHADKSDASSDHRLSVRGKILTCLSRCQRPIKIENEAKKPANCRLFSFKNLILHSLLYFTCF